MGAWSKDRSEAKGGANNCRRPNCGKQTIKGSSRAYL
jgi:hypothetical protein